MIEIPFSEPIIRSLHFNYCAVFGIKCIYDSRLAAAGRVCEESLSEIGLAIELLSGLLYEK